MQWLICGTAADINYPLSYGEYKLVDFQELISINSPSLKVNRGTPTLIAAAQITADLLAINPPKVLIVGDNGSGNGSRALYARLIELLDKEKFDLITFHYLFPDLDWHNKILVSLQSLKHKPKLIADAGYMYVAKMSGYADFYDIFTPDAGEMAFLADNEAPHPFYTRGFLLAKEEEIPHLIEFARKSNNIPQNLLVKGKIDYIVEKGIITNTVDSPNVEAMEAIGGTGDLITGMLSALIAAGKDNTSAMLIAAKANRVIGQLAKPNPATQVYELLTYLKAAVKKSME